MNIRNSFSPGFFQRGQSIVEFLVAATFVLVPALFLITSLGKIGDLQHRAYEGARYALWEKAKTIKSTEQISAELDSRLINASGNALDSISDGDPTTDSQSRIDSTYYHTNEEGEYVPIIVESKNLYSSTTIDNKKMGNSLSKARTKIVRLAPAKVDVADDGLVTSRITYSLGRMKWIDIENFKQSASNTMLTETWRAVTHKKVENAIDSAVLARAGVFDNAVLEMSTKIAEMVGLEEFAAFEPGYIEHDVVPCSRVVEGGSDEGACH